jgi:pyridoxamine 5'-phosphate oxidase
MIRDSWLAQDPLPVDPMPILETWQREAFEERLAQNPHAIALATVDEGGDPSVRMVLCKRIDTERGEVVFYSDRTSRKGRAIAAHPRAAAAFYWGPQNRQARVEGTVRIVEASDADAYFATRPSDSQIGAWASHQSRPVASRAELERRVEEEAKRLGVEPGSQPSPDIPRPPRWVGYALELEAVELWVSRPGRIHDRAVWARQRDETNDTRSEAAWGPWQATRLQP